MKIFGLPLVSGLISGDIFLCGVFSAQVLLKWKMVVFYDIHACFYWFELFELWGMPLREVT